MDTQLDMRAEQVRKMMKEEMDALKSEMAALRTSMEELKALVKTISKK